MDIATRKYVLLGTNQYPNAQEIMIDKIEEQKDEETHAGLRTYRGAQAFESLRLETETYSKKHGRPSVFLLKIGNLAMRQARAGFATNFFGCAGYQISYNVGFQTIEEGSESAKAAKAAGFIFIVAGNTVEVVDALKNAGTDDFIHVKTNVLPCLQHYNKMLFTEKC